RRQLLAALLQPANLRDKAQRKLLDNYCIGRDAGFRRLLLEISGLNKQEPPTATTLTLRQPPQPRETFVHVRGDFLRKGARASPRPPGAGPPLLRPAHQGPPNRLDLARWIASPANPLTARVFVNRVWQQYFGLGLVETENDFGTQGTPPSHPELLDWLASRFMRQGWSLKALHRLIVHSATYRQAAQAPAALETLYPRHRPL